MFRIKTQIQCCFKILLECVKLFLFLERAVVARPLPGLLQSPLRRVRAASSLCHHLTVTETFQLRLPLPLLCHSRALVSCMGLSEVHVPRLELGSRLSAFIPI